MLVIAGGENSTVGLDQCGSPVVGWNEPYWGGGSSDTDVRVEYFTPQGTSYAGPFTVSDDDQEAGCAAISHYDASLAVTPLGLVRLAWIGLCFDGESRYPWTMLQQDFYYGAEPEQVGIPYAHVAGSIVQKDASAGQTDAGVARNAWADFAECFEELHPLGLVEGPDRYNPNTISACDCPSTPPAPPGTRCRFEWQPCMSMRPSDGYYAVAWAEAETNDIDAFFNIALRVYDPYGNVVDELAGPDINDPDQWVNNPALEDGPDPYADTSQLSPAISFVGEDLVVCWLGPGVFGADHHAYMRVWARRFKFDTLNSLGGPRLRDPIPSLGEGRPGMFPVDSDSFGNLASDVAHPTVALWQYDDQGMRYSPWGRFLIAWNRDGTTQAGHGEVRAQYFYSDGLPEGSEFRVNVVGGTSAYAMLAKSGQHTIAYAEPGQAAIAFTYTAGPPETYPASVYLTILPPEYGRGLPAQCCKGDINGDTHCNGLDIQPFVDVLLLDAGPWCLSPAELCPPDMNWDGKADLDDIPLFVFALLIGDPCEGRGSIGLDDCNENGIPDANDIYNATSQDCNGNFIPDECDIAAETSKDLNENGVPDECEPDCNANGVPDDKDIADETSDDVNSNGIPDECEPDCNENGVPDAWDISQSTSADCNGNGIPDECELDCNQNGVPDDCDIDPNDPDGDEVVWPDCNGNGRPDECDFNWPPPFGSLDCNENGIPDECDIANCDPNDPACQDCNENGFPDSCDIAAEISLDENENGIPDECEGEGMMRGGTMQQESVFFGDPEARRAAWAEYYDWLAQQEWGASSELSGAGQFRAMTDKLHQLGLPVRNQRAR